MLRCLFLLPLLILTPVSASTVEVLAMEYPPFTTVSSDDQGVSFRLLRQHLATKTDLEIKARFLSPARLQLHLREEPWCASFYPPPKSQQAAVFNALTKEPIKIGLYHRIDDALFRWQSLAQLKGYRVALLRSNQGSEFIRQFVDAGLQPVFVETVEQGLMMLEYGRVDVALGDQHLKNYLSAKLNQPLNIQFSASALISTQIGYFVNPSCEFAPLLIE